MRKRIGEYLVDQGVLTPVQVQQILKYSAVHRRRFGDAGVELGLLNPARLKTLLETQAEFFYIDANLFPRGTAGALPIDLMLRHGIVPLGFKTEVTWLGLSIHKRLNVGFLDPEDTTAENAVTQSIQGGIYSRLKKFLVLADQMARVLAINYSIDSRLGSADLEDKIHPGLRPFLCK